MRIGTSDNSRRYTAGAGQLTLVLGACLSAGQLLGLLGVPQLAASSTVLAEPTTLAMLADAALADSDVGPADGGLADIGAGGSEAMDVGMVGEPLAAAPAGASVVPVDRMTGVDEYVVAAAVGTSTQLERHAVLRTARQRVVAEAVRLRGRPYRYGAAGPRAFDCSGFTKYVFRKVGRALPHNANLQQRRGLPVARTRALPGDLLVFRNGSYGFHAAIYAGGGYMYDAPRPGTRVGRHKIWSRNYVVRRLV